MSFSKSPQKKGQLKCNLCRKATAAKLGDWFVSTKTSDQQVFLCKECEAGAKGTYRRASMSTPSRN